jgi:hypothetical protein
VRIYFLQSTSKNRDTLYAPASFLRETSDTLQQMLETRAVLAQDEFLELQFRDADYEAWQVFMYWLTYREIPQAIWQNQELIVRCWGLGEWLVVFDFMSDLILRLMQLYERNGSNLSAQAIQMAFCATRMSTLQGSKLRMLIAEEIVKGAILSDRSGLDHVHQLGVKGCSKDHKGQTCGLQDLLPSMQKVELEFLVRPHLKLNRFTNGDAEHAAVWMDKMDGAKWAEVRHLVNLRVRAAVAEERAHHSA